MASKAAYFTVSDARYFPGTAALVSSLRLTGHQDEIVVLDAGLRDDQRALLASTCRIAPLASTDSGAANPTYYKLLAPLALTAAGDVDVVVLIDGDMIVTEDLSAILDAARSGKIVAYPDPGWDRWFREWTEVFDLPSEPRRQTYVNAGLVAFSHSAFPGLLSRWQEACASIADHPTVAEGAAGPTAAADQDALNAILMSTYPLDVLELRSVDEAPQGNHLLAGEQFSRPQIVDRATLACRYRGTVTRILHASGNPKPWKSWRGMARTAYTELFVDLLSRGDAAIVVDRAEIPWWLRPGRVPAAIRAAGAGVLLARSLGRRLPAAVERRVRRLAAMRVRSAEA